MLSATAYICSKGMKETKEAVVTCQSSQNGVTAVYIDGKSSFCLDGRCGAVCDIAFDQSDAVQSYMALEKNQYYWCEPFFGKELTSVPEDTQLLLIKNKSGSYTVILPCVTKQYKCVLKSGEKGLCAKLLSLVDNLNSCSCLAFVYTESDNPYTATELLIKEAIRLTQSGIKTAEEKKYPEILEYLGWCSWDAMGIRVCRDGLLEKCREFKDKNIPVRWAILDDMWADVPKFKGATYENSGQRHKLMQSSALADFEAAPDRFPKGLAHTIEQMKKYLTYVGIWHPITGYWFGIEKDSRLYYMLEDKLVKLHDGRFFPYPDYNSFYFFFNAFHKFVKDCGADFVKVDNQSIAELYYAGISPVGEMSEQLHLALDRSVGEHFDGALINCMGCSNESIFSRPESLVSRCSNDFLPENRPWFKRHILQCTFMSFMQGTLYCNDYDMWWTDDGQAVKNSLLRAISGGPIYVSDKIGRSKSEILKPLCFDDGRILRCDRSAMPTRDCLCENPENNGKIFKVQNIMGQSGAVAAFNLDESSRPVSGRISISDIEGLCGEEFAVYEYFSQKLYTIKSDEYIDVTLADSDDFRLYVFVPVKDGYAAIGRTDKFMSPVAVQKACDGEMILYENGPYAYYKDGKFYKREDI